jgi:hypothetical protein
VNGATAGIVAVAVSTNSVLLALMTVPPLNRRVVFCAKLVIGSDAGLSGCRIYHHIIMVALARIAEPVPAALKAEVAHEVEAWQFTMPVLFSEIDGAHSRRRGHTHGRRCHHKGKQKIISKII